MLGFPCLFWWTGFVGPIVLLAMHSLFTDKAFVTYIIFVCYIILYYIILDYIILYYTILYYIILYTKYSVQYIEFKHIIYTCISLPKYQDLSFKILCGHAPVEFFQTTMGRVKLRATRASILIK